MNKILLIIALVAISLPLILPYWRSRGSRKDVEQKVFGGKPLLNAFIGSGTATAQRLHWHRDEMPNNRKLSSYVHDQPITVAPAVVRELQSLLQRPSCYGWGYKHRCIVDYGVLLSFRSSKRTVRIALCFKCSELGVFDGEDDSADRINTNDVFDPSRKQLVAIVKSIYPTDSEIQELK